MKEIHGVADAHKKYVGGPRAVQVTVEDCNGEVYLRIANDGAYLTPEAAVEIAEQLGAAVVRVEMAKAARDADVTR